jgi:hypothetical protein
VRIGLTIVIYLIVFSGCQDQKQKNENSFETNRFAKDSFYYAATLIDTTREKKIFLPEGFAAILVPERWGEENDDFSVGKKIGIQMPCQCAFKDDTLTVVSALALEGGFAYISRAYKNKSSNSLKLFGKNKKWEMGGQRYNDEIEIPSLADKLVISKPLPLKEGETIYGWFDIKTEQFLETTRAEEEKKSQQHIMRIYFACQAWLEKL